LVVKKPRRPVHGKDRGTGGAHVGITTRSRL
jgi:hypothetical protein